ncbi:hypothetical protein KSS87_007018 [Heliosperma pusillum]|nr:hypothetical protein KSS87_007018 [Heliosperma pusillum]
MKNLHGGDGDDAAATHTILPIPETPEKVLMLKFNRSSS